MKLSNLKDKNPLSIKSVHPQTELYYKKTENSCVNK